MHTFGRDIGMFGLAALVLAGACHKKPEAGTGAGSGSAVAAGAGGSGATGSAAGGANSGTAAAGGTNSGTSTNGTTPSTQTGCVTKLGADMPQGDIKLGSACGPVTVEGDVTIDAKLTIEPGVVITFVEHASLSLGYNNASTVLAQGTADKPITFTSATKTPGFWKGIRLYGHDQHSVIDHVVIEGAGGDDDDSAALRVDDGVQDLTITNTEVRLAKGIGISVDGTRTLAKFEGNTSKDATVAALRISAESAPALGANNVYGDKPAELKSGTISADTTLHAPGTYRLMGDVTVERTAADKPVPTLTIDPGVTIESVGDGQLTIGYNNDGALVAKGTAAAPIKLTGFDKRKGAWRGISVNKRSTIDVENAVVEYAASSDTSGAIQVHSDATATVQGVTFAHLDGAGVSFEAGGAGKLTTKDLKIDDAKAAEYRAQ